MPAPRNRSFQTTRQHRHRPRTPPILWRIDEAIVGISPFFFEQIRGKGSSEKISLQAKKHKPESAMNQTSRFISCKRAKTATASRLKAMNMVFSRPRWSDTHPPERSRDPIEDAIHFDCQNQSCHTK